MKISCVIPTRNRADFLVEAIRSVLNQTLLPCEIIVVNNGDGPVQLPADCKHTVRLIDTVRRAGASQARNVGASLAFGEYLAFLDDDDLWHPAYLKNVAEAIKAGARCVVSRLDRLVDGRICPFRNPHKELTIENLLVFNPGVTGSNVVIAKNDFLSIGGFDVRLPTSHDRALTIEVIRGNINVVTLPQNQVILRSHGDARLTTDADKRYRDAREFVDKYRSLMNGQIYRFNMLKVYKFKHLVGCRMARVQFAITERLYKLHRRLGRGDYGKIRIGSNRSSSVVSASAGREQEGARQGDFWGMAPQ